MIVNKPLVLPISRIVEENAIMRSYYFDYRLNSLPGQFVMLWIPGVDEKPFCIAHDQGDTFFITVAAVGRATRELFKYKVGDKVGLRGPYGNHYKIGRKQKLLLVGGGYGTALLYGILDYALKNACEVDFIAGARNKDLFVLLDQIRAYKNVKLHIATDDGSEGFKGYTTDVLQSLLDEKGRKVDCILTCGPEMMMKRVSDIGFERGIPAQISVERYMKCGFGICGNCVLDPDGSLVCGHGTIFDNDTVRKFKDFGCYHRDAEGVKRYF